MTTRSSNPGRAPLLAGVAAWGAGAVLLVGLAPLPGSAITTLAALGALLLVPGLIVSLALGLHAAWSSLGSVIAACAALGSACALAAGAGTRALGVPIEAAGAALVTLELLPLALLWRGARRGTLEGFQALRGRDRAEWIADLTLAIGAIALSTTFAVWVEPAMPSGDLWYYLSYIDWIAERPGLTYVPHSLDPEEWNPRLQSSAFLALEALLSQTVRVEANALQVFWSWLPLGLLPLSLAALYGLATSLGTGPLTRAVLVVAQLLLIYATFADALDRETSGVRWAGAISFFRISQDKVFLALVLAPSVAGFAAEWLRRGERRWLAAWLTTALACGLTHPLGLPFVAMVTLPFAALGVAVGAVDWRRGAALALLLLPLAAGPALQRSNEGAPTTLADDAGFARRAHLTRDSLEITSRANNTYTAHPSLIAHPLLIAGIVCGLGLLPAVRRRTDARYAFATTAAPLLMLYTPGLAPLAGQIVTPYLLWRFTWLLPIALSVSLAGRGLTRAAARARPGSAPLAASVLTVTLAVASGLITDLRRGAATLSSLRPAPISAGQAGAIIEALEVQTDGGVVLLDPVLQSLALSLSPDLQTGYWRAGSDPRRYAAVTDLFASPSLTPAHVSLLRAVGPRWIAVAHQAPLHDALQLHETHFERVGSISAHTLFRVRDLDRLTPPANPLTSWQARVAARPEAIADREGLARALLVAGRREEARSALAALLLQDDQHAGAHEQLGTLSLEARDYDTARRHLERSLALAPDRTTARNNLTWLLATCPDPTQRDPRAALQQARALLARGTPDAATLDTVAAAQAAAGDFSAAVGNAQQAIALYQRDGVPAEAYADVTSRLAGYQAAQAFIDVAD
jgi:tetratricopeptide (TPR) repeat protein